MLNHVKGSKKDTVMKNNEKEGKDYEI